MAFTTVCADAFATLRVFMLTKVHFDENPCTKLDPGCWGAMHSNGMLQLLIKSNNPRISIVTIQAVTLLMHCAGDWGYLACRSVSAAAALEAAAEDVDINASGYLIRIQSLSAANLMYSSAQMPQTAGSRPKPIWAPFAAYAVYPDHYPPRPHSRFPEDYLPADELDHLQHPADPDHAGLLSFDQQTDCRLADTNIGYDDISAFALGMANAAEAGKHSSCFEGGDGSRGKDQAVADASELHAGPEACVQSATQAEGETLVQLLVAIMQDRAHYWNSLEQPCYHSVSEEALHCYTALPAELATPTAKPEPLCTVPTAYVMSEIAGSSPIQ